MPTKLVQFDVLLEAQTNVQREYFYAFCCHCGRDSNSEHLIGFQLFSPRFNSESNLECWAFTTCKKEKGYVTEAPTYEPTPAPIVIYVPGLNGAQVPVFGGINFEALQPTISPAPSSSSLPSVVPTLPPGVVSKQTMASYYCGKKFLQLGTAFSIAQFLALVDFSVFFKLVIHS
jgi:hypothetical protein